MWQKRLQRCRFCAFKYRVLRDTSTEYIKGTALEELRKACGMEDFTFVAAGDYNNDIELLQAADVAYCPSNAAEEVKKVADKVFEQSCEEDFIAAVIDEIFEN